MEEPIDDLDVVIVINVGNTVRTLLSIATDDDDVALCVIPREDPCDDVRWEVGTTLLTTAVDPRFSLCTQAASAYADDGVEADVDVAVEAGNIIATVMETDEWVMGADVGTDTAVVVGCSHSL